ncbi:PLxRFG domain-containing protein [Acinetobacter bereziniae]|uniref:PLxRFG domain-containing protein n=1 Tax=Acinetobacter bereziniae TaxID=106648 RepID=UPI002FDB8EFB
MSDTQDKNKSKPSFDPTTAKPVDTPLVAKSEGFNFDPSSAKETKKSKTDLIKDTGASLAAGIARIPDTLIGIGDIYTEGRLGRDIDNSDVYKTGEGQKYWEDKKSDISKEQEKTRQNIDGIWNKTKYVLENPSQITNAVVGSLPDMALGMGIGRASKIANPIVAASVGEGAVMAGAQAEGIRQQSDDQLLNNGQEAAAFGTGVIGGSLGAFGGWVANKVFKVADVDTALQTGRLTREQIGEATSQVKAKDIPLSIIKGAFSEGFLEELPQSVSEQIIQNLALDKPWNDSIEDAAVMGTLAGMAMGGTVSGVGKTMDWMNNPRSNISPQQDQIEPNNTESVGSVTPELGYNGLQGEYIPRADQVDPQQAQARYTYDQQSTDAENRLNFDNRNDLSGAMDNNDNPTGPDTPPTPNGNYFDRPNTYASIDQPPSQQMGIDPNNGPLSTAAALSVDSGASQIITTPTEQSTESTNSMLTDAAIEDNLEAQPTAQNEYTDPTAQDIQHGMSEIAKGAKEGALENTIQRLEKDGEVQLFKEDSIAKALEDQNYNVRLNDDGSASIIGVKNPATNQWHGQGKTDLNQPETSITEAQPKQIEVSQQLATLQQRFDEAKTVPEKARIRKEINALQQNHETPQGVNSNDIQSTNGAENSTSQLPNSARVDSTTTESSPAFNAENVQPISKNASNLPIEINSEAVSSDDSRKIQSINNLNTTEITASTSENSNLNSQNTILDAQNNIDKTQTNNVADQLAQLEQQFLDAKSVPQKAKLKKQIDQLKSQQTEITTTPFGSEQIQKQYGDTAESVMSDIEILSDDFTIDLRDNNKKTNALNNANYNAVQKADGSVEIVGMKHPSTGAWVGKKPNAISIDENAHQAATSSQNNTPEPTQAQIEAGNYKKGHIKVHGLDISIENPKGSERRGTDPNGKEWAHTMSDHYGYIKRTKGADNEHIDTYIGNNPDSNQVFIVDQIDQESGNFDEHKVMLGFDSQEEATTAYKSNFDKGWKVGQIRSMTMEQFKDWLKNGDSTKPATNDSKGINVVKDEQKSPTKKQDNTESQDTDSTEQTDLISKMEAKLTRLETEFNTIFNDMPFLGHGGTPFVDNSKGRQMKRNHNKRDERLQAKKKEIEEQKEKIDNMKDRVAQRSQPTKKSQKFLEGNPIHQGLFELEKLGLVKQWKKNPQYFFVNGLDKVALATWDGEIGLAKRFPVKNKEELEKAKALIAQANELVENNTKDYSRQTSLKPDEERKGASSLDTTFTPLSVVSATRRVLSILQHLKMSATQDASSRGRIDVSLDNRIGVNKVGNVNSNGFGVQVISSFRDLPKVIQNDATYQDENGNTQNYDVSAVWHDGTLYVVADQVYGDSTKQLTTFDAYEEMLAHEIIGHFGIQQIFGQEYKTKLQQLYNALGKLDGIRKIASNNGVDMAQFESAYIEPYTQGANDGIYAESDVQQALVGELFAFVAQNAKSRPFIRQKLKEVIGYIRQWFRERGFDKFLSRYNDADLMMFLSEARKAVVDRSYFGKYKNQNISAKNDSDTPLYSRSRENKAGSTVKQVRELLIDRFGKETIDELERQGKLEIIQDYQVEGVEGFYYNGKAVLVASNLTAESTVPTFLHELGGHAGFQNMMNQKQYNELMNQFNKLVEQGNPVALAAKMLAEREQGSERQQLEYLPYLLTLSSTMQQRNVIQRNALQKLINNIVSYVKAWVFDNFGINLNLNPDDMLALSERMIGQIKHQSSLDLIRQKYHGTNQWMTAPNGAKTHLSEQQWLQVRTPEFKKWFGDWENDASNASQVLDENGEPKVVYHGTATEFNEFKQGHGLLGDGIYLTDSFDTADVYANIRGENGFVLPLFVNIRNAFKTTGNVSRDEVVEATTSGKYQGIVHQFENQEYIVALEPNQVKMAEGNTGTFNSESSDIRFSRSSNDVADRLSENIKNLYSGNFKLPSMADAMKYGLMFLSRMQITDIYKAILPQLSVYNDLVRQMDADKNDIAAEADNTVREWSKLKDEEALANVMHEATLSQIDPAKPYQQGDDKLKYQQLLKKYNNLTPEAQVIYKKARNAYSKHYAKVREAVRERILRSALSSERKADLLKKIEGSFGQIKGVYFPLARFGKYVVVARNQNGDVESISRAETENEANTLREQLIQKHPQLEIGPVIRDQEYNALRDKVGRGFMSDLFDEVGNLGLDAKKQAEFEDTLGQLYLSSMPDLSWAKHGMHRKGTAGFSQNARRAFAQNMSSGAGYLAKLRYGDQLVAQLDEMEEYAKAQIKKDPGYKQPLASAVIDEMNARHENLMNAKGNAISSLLTSMGFVYFLGLSPAAAMVNIMQTPLVAYPIMGAKFGFDKAGIALIKASADYAKGVEFNMPDFTNLDSFRRSIGDSIDPDIAKILKDHEKQAYDKAISAGVIDVTQAHDLAGIAQGEDSGIMWKTRPIMRAASLMFHHAERFNREVTFIAAYRLSKESGMADNDAYKQAVKMTYDGHFDYSASNRARFMQGNVAKVVFLFKQFGQNMIYTIARQSYIALIGKNHTKEERIEAARAISAMLVTHALAAGVLGLPMVTTILAIASGLVGMAGGGDDDPWDAEVALRNGLADMTSPTFSNLVMKGLSRGTPADISGRVGLDSMFLAKTQDGLEGQKLYEQLIIGNLGATVGMGANIAKGIQELGQGNYARALEEMLPTFAKNPFKAYRYATEGVQDKTGVDILDGHPVSGAGIFSQTIGFSPSQVRTAYEGKSAIYQQQQALQKRKSKLTANWVRAKRNDDQEGMDSAWKDIQEFNEVNPKLRINRINLMQSYHQNAKRIRDAENGVYLSKKYRDIGDYGRFAETD